MNRALPQAMREPAKIRTGCKINLFLNICSLREDGYHELQTLFYPLSMPFDDLHILPVQDEECCLHLSCPALPSLASERTTLHKALEAFSFATGLRCSYEVLLRKQVPAGAGLGGGSANAAGFLKYLNERAGERGLSEEKLLQLAVKVGADVPFFLMNKPALAEGIGDRLVPAEISLAGSCLVLVCPGVHVSTPWAYKEWDSLARRGEVLENNLHAYFYRCLTSEGLTGRNSASGSSAGKADSSWPWFYNNLEQAVFPGFPEIAAIKEKLIWAGARAALMSGSGSSVFGIFENEESARKAAEDVSFREYRTIVQILTV